MRSLATSKLTRKWLSAVSVWSLSILLIPAGASAATVTVNCSGGGPGSFSSITAALNALHVTGPHHLTVSGTCRENVEIHERDRVTIEAPVGQMATVVGQTGSPGTVNIIGSRNIHLRRLVIRDGGRHGVNVQRESSVEIQGCQVTNNARHGISVFDSYLGLGGGSPEQAVEISNNGRRGLDMDGGVTRVRGGVTVENNQGEGLWLSGGRAVVGGKNQENIVRDNGGGGVVVLGTMATINGKNTIQSNGDRGVLVSSSSTLSIAGDQTIIEGHRQLGVSVHQTSSVGLGPTIIRNNGTPGDLGELRGGVSIGSESRGSLNGTEITNNIGAGLEVSLNGLALVRGNTLITNNTEEGVRLVRESVAVFGRINDMENDENTIVGNGGPDLFCDSTALASGTFKGIGTILCSRTDHELSDDEDEDEEDGR